MKFLYIDDQHEKIFVLGDVNALFPNLTLFVRAMQPTIILQVGDFGYYPHNDKCMNGIMQLSKTLLEYNCKLYFCDGNHEDHKTLTQIQKGQKKQSIEIAGNIFYQPRASVLTLPNSKQVLFVGGAKSVDWKLRKLNYSWFTEELLDEKDIKSLPKQVDLIISHTAPQSLILPQIDDLSPSQIQLKEISNGWDLQPDCSRAVLDIVYEKVKSPVWCFGHFHGQYTFKNKILNSIHQTTTDFIGLDSIG